MFDDDLAKIWLVIFSFVSTVTSLLSVQMWFRLRAIEKSELAKTTDLYDQIDGLKNRIDSMFN